MSHLLLTTLAALGGICLYAAMHHLWMGSRPPSQRLHVWFALLSFLVGLYVFAKIGTYRATSAPALVAARRLELSGAALAIGVLPWFVAAYVGARARGALLGLSALLGALVVANLALPYGVVYSTLPAFAYFTLPWGEQVADIRVGQGGPWFIGAWAVVLLSFAFSSYLCAHYYRHGDRKRAARLAIALSVFLAFVLSNLVVNFGLVNFTHTAEFGFIALVLLMNGVLSQELRASRVAHFESEKRFRTLAEQAADAIFVHDVQGRLLDVNQQACQSLGYSREELLQMSVADIETEVSAERAQALWNTMRPGSPLTVEGQHRRRDGSLFPVEARVGLFHAEGRDLAIAIVRDISERRRAETALRDSAERLRTILELEPECVKVLGRDGSLLEMNRAGLAMIEAESLEQVRGHPVIDIVAPAYRAGFIALSRRVFQGESGQFEFEIIGLKGTRRWLETRAVPLRDAKTGEVTLLGVTRDVTARKQADEHIRALNIELEQRVQARTAQLEAALRELEAFNYAVSHDLRAPLRAVDGFAQALSEDCAADLNATGQDYLRRIRGSTERMAMLIDALLQLSRFGREAMTLTTVDLSALACEIAEQLTAAAPQRAATLTIAPGLSARGDARLLGVVLTNLLGNAWKYSAKAYPTAIEFGQQQADDQTVFYVRDNGVGFDMQYAGKLFGAFQRLHAAQEFEGTGIGLATVQRIIHRHGGRVWAEAAPDQGATFFFTLGAGAGQ